MSIEKVQCCSHLLAKNALLHHQLYPLGLLIPQCSLMDGMSLGMILGNRQLTSGEEAALTRLAKQAFENRSLAEYFVSLARPEYQYAHSRLRLYLRPHFDVKTRNDFELDIELFMELYSKGADVEDMLGSNLISKLIQTWQLEPSSPGTR